MSEAARSRYALDLDDIERQIREASSRPAVQGQAAEDPLAELARIVSGNGRIRPESTYGAQPQNVAAPLYPAVAPVTPHDLSQVVAREFGNGHAAVRHGAHEPALGLEQDIEALLARGEARSQQTAVIYDEFAEAMRSFEQVIAEPRMQAAASQELTHHNANASSGTASTEAVGNAYGQETYQQSYHPAPAQHAEPVDFQRELSDMIAAQTQQPQQAAEAPAFAHGIPEPEPEFYPAYADTAEPLAPRRSRKKSMMLVAAVVGVAAVGVGGALSFRGKGGIQANGEPPLIRAADGPSKIAPANPGGTDVPDQNRQILERSAPKTAATPPKVVASDEQPLDLKEAVRKEAAAAPEAQATAGAPRVILSSPLPIPPAGSAVEPRRVKTVVIRPPGAPASPAADLAAPPAALTPPPPPVRTASLPPKPAEPVAAAPVPAPAVATPAAPPAQAAQVAKPKPKPASEAKPVQARPATPVAPVNTSNDDPVATGTAPMSIVPSGQPKRNQRLPQQAAVAAPAAVQSDAQPAAASGGGFVVQLSSEGSDAEARASAARFKSRFGELGDVGSSIQRRDVNGQTRYRVRFGGMSRDDANELCSSLKGKGQACIVQPN